MRGVFFSVENKKIAYDWQFFDIEIWGGGVWAADFSWNKL